MRHCTDQSGKCAQTNRNEQKITREFLLIYFIFKCFFFSPPKTEEIEKNSRKAFRRIYLPKRRPPSVEWVRSSAVCCRRCCGKRRFALCWSEFARPRCRLSVTCWKVGRPGDFSQLQLFSPSSQRGLPRIPRAIHSEVDVKKNRVKLQQTSTDRMKMSWNKWTCFEEEYYKKKGKKLNRCFRLQRWWGWGLPRWVV